MEHETINFTLIIKLPNSEVPSNEHRDLEFGSSENFTLGDRRKGNKPSSATQPRDGRMYFNFSITLLCCVGGPN